MITNLRMQLFEALVHIYKCDSEDNSSLAEAVSSSQSTQLKEKLLCVPANIAQSQKLLKTSIFQTPEPQFPTKCLILNIYKIKHQQLEVRALAIVRCSSAALMVPG